MEDAIAPPLSPPASLVPAGANGSADDPHVRRTLRVLAVACGLSVANLYYNQPLLADIAQDLKVSESAVGIIPTLSQVGYALGLAFIVPLGDVVRRRPMVVWMLMAVCAGLLAAAASTNLPCLAAASLAIGIATVVPQVLVPFAAKLVPPERRGKAIGGVMFGLLSGILLSRTLAGFVGKRLGWHAMYWIAAGMMALLALALSRLLPHERTAPGNPNGNENGQSPASERMGYGQLLRSVLDLARSQRVIRQAGVNGGLLFGAFLAFWAALVFHLEADPFHYTTKEATELAGLFGIVAAVGAAAAPVVGHWADRIGSRVILTCATVLMIVSYGIYWAFGSSLVGLIVGVILMDLAMQSAQVANQSRIYRLPAASHSRVNTAYMTVYFVGGSLGSLMASYGWKWARWQGVCAVGLTMSSLALVVHLLWKPDPTVVNAALPTKAEREPLGFVEC